MTDTIIITPTRCVFNGGQFDSDHRYLRSTDANPVTVILAGPSIGITPSSTYNVVAWRFECAGYVINAPAYRSGSVLGFNIQPPSSVPNTPTPVAL